MKSTLLTILTIAASCALSQGVVTFTSIQQDVDGSLTDTTLQNVTGASGSSQTISGDPLGVGIPYESFAFTVDLFAAAGSPTPGNASITLQFIVSEDTAYSNLQADNFFGTTDGPIVDSSGTLTPGQAYFLSTSFTGGATVPANEVAGLTVGIPEPSTSLLALLGVVGLMRRRR